MVLNELSTGTGLLYCYGTGEQILTLGYSICTNTMQHRNAGPTHHLQQCGMPTININSSSTELLFSCQMQCDSG
jgi:hypothetical protein